MVKPEQLARTLRALADEDRLRLVAMCAAGPARVSDLAAALGDSEPTVSRALKQLAEAGVLRRARRGQAVEYVLDHRDPFASAVAGLAIARMESVDGVLRGAHAGLHARRDHGAAAGGARHRLGLAVASVLIESLADRSAPGVVPDGLAASAGPRSALLLHCGFAELIDRIAATVPATSMVVRTVGERARWRRWSLESGRPIEVLLSGEFGRRQVSRGFDLIVVDLSTAEAGVAAMVEHEAQKVVHELATGGSVWVVARYDALESSLSGAAAPPRALSEALVHAGLSCAALHPIEAGGVHLLIARSHLSSKTHARESRRA